jgi:hypothetical protein
MKFIERAVHCVAASFVGVIVNSFGRTLESRLTHVAERID